jgi:LytS/YehU family sensor histidine kinase
MNPHFIFNALTGISKLLLREDLNNALTSVKKFRGLLIRSWGNTLENPQEVFNSTLREEFLFLNDYVDLEQMRLSTPVDFKVKGVDLLGQNYPKLLNSTIN